MSTAFIHGFRVVGDCSNQRTLVNAGEAFAGYAACAEQYELRGESYLSMFQFGDDFAESLKRTDSTKGFDGPTWAPYVWLDVDRVKPAEAVDSSRKIVAALAELYGVADDDVLAFFSGQKGYHIGIPTALWNPEPRPQFHRVARRFAEGIAARAGVAIDTGVYDRVRCFRAPNSRHPKTGLYKRWLSFGELMHLSPDGIRQLAEKPAPFEIPTPTYQSAAAAQLWTEAVESVQHEVKATRRSNSAAPPLAAGSNAFSESMRNIIDPNRFDCTPSGVRAWLEARGVVIKEERHVGDKTMLLLDHCPINPAIVSEGGSDIAVLVADDGKLAYCNKHNRGSDYTWHDLRHALDPSYKQTTRESTTRPRTAVVVSYAEIKRQSVRWLWPNRIALGELTAIAGDPGLGKSFLLLDVAAKLSTGGPWSNDHQLFEPASTIILSAEDSPQHTISPRLIAAGANLSQIQTILAVRCADQTEAPFDFQHDLGELRSAIKATPDCRLVIVDPVSAYMGGNCDSHKNADVRAVLAPLAKLASDLNVAIVLVNHLTKAAGIQAVYRVSGSLAYVAAVRMAWLVMADPNDRDRRLMVCAKNNLGPRQTGLAFKIERTTIPAADDGDAPIETARLIWDTEPVQDTAEEAMQSWERLRDRGKGSPRRDDAAAWLHRRLADGPVLKRILEDEAAEAGISKGTLTRAKDSMPIKATKAGMKGGWSWELDQSSKKITIPPDTETVRSFADGALLRVIGGENEGCSDPISHDLTKERTIHPVGKPVCFFAEEPPKTNGLANLEQCLPLGIPTALADA